MVLANNADDSAMDHLFRYAHVLGIYHVNAVYMGLG